MYRAHTSEWQDEKKVRELCGDDNYETITAVYKSPELP